MAVKQNNTESNGQPLSANGNTANASGGSMKTNIQGGASGAGTKSGIKNSNMDGGGGNAEQPGCSGTGSPPKPKCPSGAATTTNIFVGASPTPAKLKDITHILQFIEFLEFNQQQVSLGQDILKIYQHVIIELARVQIPRQTPEELKRFKEDILKVSAFFEKAGEKNIYLFYLGIVCQLITQSDDPPSCAVAIIFQLFNADMVYEAVASLLDHKIPDQNIRKTVRLLSEWLRMCNFCQNLNLWIMAILNGLQEQQKFELFDEIALENIEPLFSSLILPVLRPKVAPIVFHMLLSVNHSPLVFHKILPKFNRVLSYLKQQPNSQTTIQKLVDITSALMVRFYGYGDLYEPVELALKEFQPSFNYLNCTNRSKFLEDGSFICDEILTFTNAKVGLVNLGNTCYMNSVLQALAMTKEFSREILLLESKSQLLIKMQQQIALMLYSIRNELTPSRVLNATRPPGFSPGIQQDSSEFLGYLLDTLHEQEVAFRKSTTVISDVSTETVTQRSRRASESAEDAACTEGASAFSNDNEFGVQSKTVITSSINTDEKKCKSTNNQHSNTSSSFTSNASSLSTIEKTFTGKLATTYKCLTCGWKSCNVDSFRDLQLSFPEVKNDCASNYSVQDLIDYYCTPEKLYGDNQYFCEQCRRLSDAERHINVISAPKNLILTLKHFKYDQKYHMRAKLMHKVFHDEKVSVKVYSTESLEDVSVHYDLYAGVVHSGFSMDSGHYYTYAADDCNKWYKFNDNIVTASKSEELHNLTPPNTPYILFYQMGAHSNESVEAPATATKVTKVDVPAQLKLEELPRDLRDYVNHDNCIYTEELKLRRFRSSKAAMAHDTSKVNGRYDADDDQPPPGSGSGCGGNAMNINVNRFVF